MTMSSAGVTTFTDSNGATTTISYSGDSNFIGTLTCEKTEGCKVNQCEFGTNGNPLGKYGVNNYNKNKVARRRLQEDFGINPDEEPVQHMIHRYLAASTTTADTATISNPVVCLENGDTMQFEVNDYSHYPVYDENNILNTNLNFDYGPFIELGSQITAKSLAGLTGSTDPVLFSYTFTEGGTYVFVDKTTTTNQIVIVVANSGETCPDSTSNIATSTSRALSQTGTTQADNIVLALDVPLLCSIIGLCIIIVVLIGVSVAYCLHKAFDCKIPKIDGYRTYQKNHDLDFELLGQEDSAEVANPHCLDNIKVEDEDDMDLVSFDIHRDIVNHSEEFLELLRRQKEQDERKKAKERKDILDAINDLTFLINLIGDTAITGKMYYGAAKDYEEVIKEIEGDQKEGDDGSRPGTSDGRRGDGDDEDDHQKRLNQEVLEKEEELRGLIIRDNAQNKEERIKREIMKEMNGEDSKEFDEEEIPGGDQQLSLMDRIRNKIQGDENFDELNRNKMLFDHDKKLEGIESELEKERKRQENALAQLLRSKADQRRKKKAIEGNDKEDDEELEKVQKQYEDKLRDKFEEVDQEIYEQEVQMKKGNNPEAKENIDMLKQRKKEITEKLEKERLQAAKDAMDRLNKKGEMDEKEIASLIDKFIPRDSQEKLAIDQDFEEHVQKINREKESELDDLKRRQEEEMAELQDRLSGADDDTIDLFINTLSQRVIDQNYDADEEEKSKHLDRMNNLRKMLKDNDNKLEKDSLINAWDANAKDMENVMMNERNMNDARLRERLKKRKNDKKKKMIEALKIAHEEEEAKLILDQLGREHNRKSEINRDQISRIVKLLLKELEKAKKNGEEIPELTMAKIKQLFESMFAEVEMADFTNQLVRQFAEKEVMLKRLLARYVDIQRMEKASIKKHYDQKMKDLEEKADELDPEAYDALKKDLILSEEKALRDLNLDKLHKEEEAALMQSLEKKHAKESIQLKNDLLEEKIKATNELFRNLNRRHNEEEIRIYKKAFNNYKAKKEKDLERRLRSIEFAKSKVINEIEKEIQNKISDYEELIRRRAKEEEEMRKALEAHKALIKARMDAIGVTDKDKIFDELNKNYKGLTHSIEQERKRMFTLAQQRDQKRRDAYKDRNFNDFLNNLAKGGQKVAFMSNKSYMGRMLNDWKTKNEALKMKLRLESTLRLNWKNLQTPESLMAELLRRVKNLENLLRSLDMRI
eukprot:CAMPEP_0197000254 /NCGR_PEP_ID=MMETSP1380-20130617/5237_1 /TAXON_ID=5936 /ORGANISM="Euplotes crassus, Strain CT5" /LENGTH=1215 /DNA_ID=CAMNT_0042417483 /DNA_START=1832 /DNA_END=5479 /DNA_ORIENTATION=-